MLIYFNFDNKNMEEGNNDNKIKKTVVILYLEDDIRDFVENLKEKWNMKTRSKVIKQCIRKQMALENV